MKLFLVLLACFAAANASYIYVPSTYTYYYYCQHHFNVYPPMNCYKYTVYFPSTWCSTKYYAPLLKYYPNDQCGTHCWSETSVADLIKELRNCLKNALSPMTGEIYRRRDAFVKKLDDIHAEYVAVYRRYVYMYYLYRYRCGYYVGVSYIAQRDAQIRAYCDKLDQLKRDVIAKFNAAIAAKIKALTDFQDRLVKAATDCLNTRLAKIAEFRANLDKKINSYYSKFYSVHCAIALKNRDHYKDILRGLFCEDSDWWNSFKASIAVSYYYGRQKSKVYYLARDYRNKLYSFKAKLITYYTCAYRCYVSTGAIQFYSKSYYAHCKSLGNWYCYKSTYCYDHYCLGPWKVKFTPKVYRCLKTCNVDTVVGDISGVVADLKSKRDAILREHTSQFFQWKSKWIGYHNQYKAKYRYFVQQRHAFLCEYQRRCYLIQYGCLSYVHTNYIAQLKADLEKRARETCAEYARQLSVRISECYQRYLKEQAAYRKTFDDLIAKIEKAFNDCKSKRITFITDYRAKLEASIKKQRSDLVTSLYKSKNAHWSLFHKMLAHYHGSCYYKYTWIRWMRDCYGSVLVRRCSKVLGEFDAFWRSMLPRLVQHYSCGYTCKVSTYCVPKYHCGTYYTWTFKCPTYHIYTYRLTLYSKLYKYY